ncbi:MAG: hypothetical protein ACXABO_02455 [Promethearchaeota archaeon]|jgi:DNA-binding transcriptional regulator GbsR (MarR family)
MTNTGNIDSSNHLFDEKLRYYEDTLVELLLDIAQQKRVNQKISTITAYLLIHRELTQKEIKELTGFSMGTISTILSVLIGAGNFFSKRRIPKTHKFTYSFSGELEDLTVRGIEFAISSLTSLESFLRNVLKNLENLEEENKKGAKHLSSRINELVVSFEYYKEFFPDLIKLNQFEKESIPQKNSNDENVEEIEFDNEIYVIEGDIHNQLAATPIFSTKDPQFVKILGLFITRKYLTQKSLQQTTGLSAGKISQEVNQLLFDGLIEEAAISEKGKITYSASSAGLVLLKFTRSIIGRFVKWENELKNMETGLKTNRLEYVNLKGFEQVNRIIVYMLKTIAIYKKPLELIDKELERSKQGIKK